MSSINRNTSTPHLIKRHTIIAGDLNQRPLVGQFLEDWSDYKWLNSWEVLWRIQRGDTQYCVVSNTPKFSLAEAAYLADAAHAGKLRVLALNEIPGVQADKNGGK